MLYVLIILGGLSYKAQGWVPASAEFSDLAQCEAAAEWIKKHSTSENYIDVACFKK